VTERVVVSKKVTLRGAKAAVVASPDATGTVIELRAPARLERLAVQGGEVGVRATDGAALLDVDFSAQRRAAVSASGAVQIEGGRMAALFDRPELGESRRRQAAR
jgi:nitrous oxidase accessory protein NosD